MDDLIKEFLTESSENLDRLDGELVKLEAAPDSAELLASIFRTIHTIKGTCGFLGFERLGTLTHTGENLLSRLRDGTCVVTSAIASALLSMVDSIRAHLREIATTGREGTSDDSELIQHLKDLQTKPEVSESRKFPVQEVRPLTTSARKKKFQPEIGKLGGVLSERLRIKPDALAQALEAQEQGDTRPLGEILLSLGLITAKDLEEALAALEQARSRGAESNLRVHVALLDRLMDLMGELVLARNQILGYAVREDDPAFLSVLQRLNLVTSELREAVMKTRMQPISRLFDKVPRIVRDVSSACGKQVRVEVEGKDTELDRTLIEAIADPLTHLVRNAVDHGIEMPDRRISLNKPPEGLLRLHALHEGGQVTIEIADDGAGLDIARIRQKALDKALISADQAARMSPEELTNLIFLPGLSTAQQVTSVSGRGVGMDVVKTNIKRVGGSVEIASEPDRGTTLRLKLPLTLAIVPALIVRSRNRRYAIPQVNLVELVRLEPEDASHKIERVHEALVYRLRGRLLPLVFLRNVLWPESPDALFQLQENLTIVVVEADGRRFGLVVDQVDDAEEIVVKPLEAQLRGIAVFAGATVLGDGQVAIILDIPALAHRARLTSQSSAEPVKALELVNHPSTDAAEFLLCSTEGGRQLAVPLARIVRLERVPSSQLERAGNREVIQYRGQIMPLYRVGELLGEGNGTERETLDLLVCQEQGRWLGLVVGSIHDITQLEARPADAAPTTGSAVLQLKVRDLLDVDKLLHGLDPAFQRSTASGDSAWN